jgi:hypothetical protein
MHAAAAGSGDASSSSSPVKQQQRRPPAARVGEAAFVDPHCERDVRLFLADEGPLPGGEPGFRAFSVEIVNISIDRRTLYNVRISCGGFSGYYLHVPDGFSRISDSECVVNGGGEFRPTTFVKFEYASTSEYPFAVTSIGSVSC